MIKNIKIPVYILVLLAIVVGIWFWSGNNDTSQKIARTIEEANEVKGVEIENSGDPILFYGATCPHCKELEEYIEDNKIEERMNINKKEVYYNEENADLLKEKASECDLDLNRIGVPFLFAGGKCYIGSEEAKSFFEQN